MRGLLLSLLLFGTCAPQVAAAGPAADDASDLVAFAADELVYDEPADLVIATGNVVLRRRAQVLTADRIVWDRRAGTVAAEGHVRIGDDRGNVLVADRMALSEDLADGAVENLLVVLEDGGRLAARRGDRRDGATELERAIYSPCAVVDEAGCPQTPLWAVKAVRVRHDPARRRVHYRQARLEAWGVPILGLPRFSHPDSALRNQSGLLSPDLGTNPELGLEIAVPWYWSIAPNRDLTATARIFSAENPLLELEYRHLLTSGPLRVNVRGTWSEGRAFDEDLNVVRTGREAGRWLLEGNGRFAHRGGWRSTFSARLTNDPNFPGRYQITYDARLRTTYALERQDPGFYAGARGWYVQDLAPGARADRVPVAMPLLDLAWVPRIAPLGGRVRIDANALSLFRTDGQDANRLVASARWDRRLYTRGGQQVTLTGLLRTDIYGVSDSAYADAPVYAGRDGLRGRFVPLGAVDVAWPLAGPLGRGTQILTPRLQLVASSAGRNRGLPNEDSRSIDLDDINLFAFNRFPGFDRWEGGVRLAYGLAWAWTRPRLALSADIGQSLRLTDPEVLFPVGTGLSETLSDIVGRVTLRTGRLGSITQRFRLDKDDLTVRRSELDVTLGTDRTFASVGYFRFNRDIDLEDLVDQEEIRFGGQFALFRYWSVFASAIIDLTSTGEDPFTTNDGFQPVRHRVGFIYADECFDFRFTWRRNYIGNINAPLGNSFSFSLRLKNLGVNPAPGSARVQAGNPMADRGVAR